MWRAERGVPELESVFYPPEPDAGLSGGEPVAGRTWRRSKRHSFARQNRLTLSTPRLK